VGHLNKADISLKGTTLRSLFLALEIMDWKNLYFGILNLSPAKIDSAGF
jgi:hypothetical protein